jgi:hypothetical protein
MHVLYCDESFEKLAEPTTLAEMLGCKLLSTATLLVHIKHLYFTVLYMMCWKSPMASHARALSYGEQPYCHSLVAEFLLHIFKNNNKASNTEH